MIQANKGFLIHKECEARSINLQIPPGKKGKCQMSVPALVKTKRIANVRILVEQVIRRLKTFVILKNEIPISIVYLI